MRTTQSSRGFRGRPPFAPPERRWARPLRRGDRRGWRRQRGKAAGCLPAARRTWRTQSRPAAAVPVVKSAASVTVCVGGASALRRRREGGMSAVRRSHVASRAGCKRAAFRGRAPFATPEWRRSTSTRGLATATVAESGAGERRIGRSDLAHRAGFRGRPPCLRPERLMPWAAPRRSRRPIAKTPPARPPRGGLFAGSGVDRSGCPRPSLRGAACAPTTERQRNVPGIGERECRRFRSRCVPRGPTTCNAREWASAAGRRARRPSAGGPKSNGAATVAVAAGSASVVRPAACESARQRANATALACLRARGVGGSDFARGAASRRRGRRAPRRNPHCPNSSSGELQ